MAKAACTIHYYAPSVSFNIVEIHEHGRKILTLGQQSGQCNTDTLAKGQAHIGGVRILRSSQTSEGLSKLHLSHWSCVLSFHVRMTIRDEQKRNQNSTKKPFQLEVVLCSSRVCRSKVFSSIRYLLHVLTLQVEVEAFPK